MPGRTAAVPAKPDYNQSQIQSFLDEHVDLLTYVNWQLFQLEIRPLLSCYSMTHADA